MNKFIYLIALALALPFFVSCDCQKQGVCVEVKNDSNIDRENEMVELAWSELKTQLSIEDASTLIVLDEAKKQLPYQAITMGSDAIQSIIFPVSVKAGKEAKFTFTTGTPESFEAKVVAHFVPERKDDFAWENDKNAFRMYGPALEATGEISNGIDIWVKRTTELVQRKWYESEFAGKTSYHRDYGEGLDFYKVGRTLGMGAAAPFMGGKLWLGNNFISYKILDNGPLRATFQLNYASYEVAEKQVVESRIISLDAYSYFNKITELYEYDLEMPMKLAVGIVHRNEDKKLFKVAPENNYMAYEEPADKKEGIIYVGVVAPEAFEVVALHGDHLLGIASTSTEGKYTYYTGGGWSKAGFNSLEEWTTTVANFAATIAQPLKVELKK